ncbi:MAG TPA: hypothetical protein RMG48_04355 [Myxococcales bacterium LLY-WYZ-16_1]|nr:hypothetical protein [Myxococcales bacterium LLY-WYZ-16_1]
MSAAIAMMAVQLATSVSAGTGSSALLEEALAASDAGKLRTAYRTWQRRLEDLKRLSPEARAHALLQRLHQGPLERYQADATTLAQVFEHGRFNCVSSALLYNLLAMDLGLEVRAELMPTHARSLVRIGTEWKVVETTSRQGFAPGRARSADILRRVVGRAGSRTRSLVEGTGERHPTRALVAIMYVNLGIFAQQSEQPSRAEALFARAESIAATPRMRQVLVDQRAVLLGQMAVQAFEDGHLSKAVALLRRALELDEAEPDVKRTLRANLAAFMQRRIRRDAARISPAALVRHLRGGTYTRGLDGADAARVQAFGWSEVAHRHAEQEHWVEAFSAYDAAWAHRGALGPERRQLLWTNRSKARKAAAVTLAQRGELQRALRWASTPTERKKLHEVHVDHAVRTADEANVDQSTRACLAAHPESQFCRENRVAWLQRQLSAALRAGPCTGGREFEKEMSTLVPEDRFSVQSRVDCWSRRAERAFRRDRFERAARAFAEAFVLVPNDARLRDNLRIAFRAWARSGDRDACRVFRKTLRDRLDSAPIPSCKPR